MSQVDCRSSSTSSMTSTQNEGYIACSRFLMMIHIPQVRCRCTNVCKLNFNAGAIHFASFIDLRLVKSPCVLAKLLFSFLSPSSFLSNHLSIDTITYCSWWVNSSFSGAKSSSFSCFLKSLLPSLWLNHPHETTCSNEILCCHVAPYFSNPRHFHQLI